MNNQSISSQDITALVLRIGLGSVFLIGGFNKLAKLFDPATHDALVASYTGAMGYINSFFLDYLFTGRFGTWLTPDLFLTTLSTFELLSGLLLLMGLVVRPLSLVYAFLLWSFVFALPVNTVPGVMIEGPAISSPALLVQVRDIGLSGMMFILFALGAGAYSFDRRLGLESMARAVPSWEQLGLVLRLSLGLVFLVGGAFAGMDHIQSFAVPGWILFVLGLMLVSGTGVRIAGYAVIVVMIWYIGTKLSVDKNIIGNLNGIKREIALLAAGAVLGWRGGGVAFSLRGAVNLTRSRST